MTWQTLAPELIYEVLNQCRADSKTLSVTELHSFPWYLGHICRGWREVFVSSPRFWSTLNIQLDCNSLGSIVRWESTVLEVIRIGIVRSRDCPISFRLSIVNCSFPEEIILCRQIIKILVANSARWFDAYISVLATEMATIYAAKNRMPLLRSIELVLLPHPTDKHTNFRASNAAKLCSDFLMGTPQLTRISFHNNSPFWKINWSLITVIYFYAVPSLSQLLAYLSQTSCLMELVILGNFKGDEISNDRIVPVPLPHLKSLYSPAALLPIVDTPALQELHIRNDICMIKDKSALKAIISRYFQPIRHLSKLEITTIGWEDAALIIEHMPRVDHLTLHSEIPVELVEILKDYPQMGFLKTVTFILQTSEVERDHLLETITSWKRETGENRGIGPFHILTEMSFKLLSRYHQRFVDGLTLHLEEQGMDYSISESEPGRSFPRFDVL